MEHSDTRYVCISRRLLDILRSLSNSFSTIRTNVIGQLLRSLVKNLHQLVYTNALLNLSLSERAHANNPIQTSNDLDRYSAMDARILMDEFEFKPFHNSSLI